MAGSSLSDVAYRSLKRKRKQVVFNRLWKEVCDDVGYTDEMAKKKIASFYNALMLDSRFISLEGNQWDLRERYAEDTLKIDPDFADAYEDYEEFEDDDYTEEDSEI